MRRIITGLMAAVQLAASASPALAEGGGSSAPIVVDSITVLNGNLYLRSSQFLNPDSCASSAIAVVLANTPRWEAFYSAALTSITTGKPTSLWFSGCSGVSPWVDNLPVIVLISIHK